MMEEYISVQLLTNTIPPQRQQLFRFRHLLETVTSKVASVTSEIDLMKLISTGHAVPARLEVGELGLIKIIPTANSQVEKCFYLKLVTKRQS